MTLRGIAVAAAVCVWSLTTLAQTAQDQSAHLGVATCAGSNCHGATTRLPGVRVAQDEYLIWKNHDRHARAYTALASERGQRIARNLRIADATKAALCLVCHSDFVPPERRGPRFDIADGVGCEACHGGALPWLGIHISGADHPTNLAHGLYPMDDPLARANRCLDCHVGDGTSEAAEPRRFVTHEIMGAGHPPMPFELDTFTQLQPAHFVVDASYAQRRKPIPNDVKMWVVGQAVDLKRRMDLVLDPANAPKGANPELSLFDCQACHHGMNRLQWRPRSGPMSGGHGPGKLRLYDASAVMLYTIAQRVAPDRAASIATHVRALHAATVAPKMDYWLDVRREAAAVRREAEALIPVLERRDFTADDARALAAAVAEDGLSGGDLDYAGAHQEAMALRSIAQAMRVLAFAPPDKLKPLDEAIAALQTKVADDQAYDPDAFAAALRRVAAALPAQAP